MGTQLVWPVGIESRLTINPEFDDLDCDSLMVYSRWQEPAGSMVLEVGANEEHTAQILHDNDHRVLGVDLRDHTEKRRSYARMQGDFVRLAPFLKGYWDVAVTTSAIEHFGLGLYGDHDKDNLKDMKAMIAIHRLLRPGGRCYVTVPYGKRFFETIDWRIYDAAALQDRIVGEFSVVEKVFFKSAEAAGCPDDGGIVKQEDADLYDSETHPHVTVFLLLEKE